MVSANQYSSSVQASNVLLLGDLHIHELYHTDIHTRRLLAPDDAKSQSCFSFFHQLAETLRNLLHEMYKAPSQALALSVADIWGADIVSRRMLSNLISPSPRYPSLQLPSMRQSEEEITFFSHIGTSFTLEWQNQVLKYENDLKIYVWQPHLQRRPDIYNVINIVIMPARDGESQQRMAMSLHPPKLLSAFLQFHQTRMSTQILLDQHPWSAKHELFLTLVAVLDWMASDITSFVDNIAYELREMVRAPVPVVCISANTSPTDHQGTKITV